MHKILSIAIITLALASSALGQGASQGTEELVVGTKETAPFVMKNADGSWTGISIELWRGIAQRLGYSYRIEERELEGLLAGLQDGSLDVVAGALTVTSDREEATDFSHPFYTTGLTIATTYAGSRPWLSVLKRLFSTDFLAVVAALLALLCLLGIVVWAVERRHNPEQFGGSFWEGIGSGIWWSAVTMTTVGYGDKAPQTLFGRLIGLVWMFAAIIMLSSFTAAIASSLTVSQLESKVQGVQDLPNVRVGSVPNSTSAAFLEDRSIRFADFATPAEGLQAVSEGRIDAFVYDAPILRYLAKTDYPGKVRVLPGTFSRQDYGLALQQGSPYRESINRILLQEIRSPKWGELLKRYLGE
ncbi:transporter substrate-binding domain-containing protein [bacterium]|nr:transporter substrate-binding domain-containing protein [bacterium]